MPLWVTSRSLRVAKRVGQPAVQGHVGQHARAVKEARLRGDEEERGLGDERDQDEGERGAMAARRGQLLEQDRVERLAGLGRDAVEQVADEQAGDGDGQRDGHVEHGALAGLDARFAQDGQAVADGLDAGVSARAHAVGAQHQQRHAEPAQFADARRRCPPWCAARLRGRRPGACRGA